ncbi:MAG TPA: hypothetical protein VGQ21_01975 [Thermoanaerobaculia bacterium]|nr:hypothetical protein [Thermoanaerobaculia bacterium]
MSPKAAQQRLQLPPPQLIAGAGLAEPSMWVRRLFLWHDFNGKPVREIDFHLGLNVIWSPTGPSAREVSTGHAAGKTLLCRQIRFCLGEESFADDEDTAAIRARFANGGIGAEIRLRGETWVVRRAFRTADDRATKSEDIEDLTDEGQRGTFSSFRAELEAVAFGDAQQRLLKEIDDVDVPWQYVLAWLTRDQECRLDGLTHWRHKESSSHSPVRKSAWETRLNILRVVLGLYSEHSNAARKRVAEAAKEVSKSESDSRLSDARFTVLRDDLAKALALHVSEVWPPNQEFFQDEQSAREAQFRGLNSVADERIRAVRAVAISDEQRADEDELQATKAELGVVEQQIEGANEAVKSLNAHLELLSTKSAEDWSALRRAKHPTCPYDDAPLDVERSQFVCPLPKLPDPVAVEELAKETEAHRSRISEKVASEQNDLVKLKGLQASLRAKSEKLERRIAVHQLSIEKASAASQAAWAAKGTLQRLAETINELEDAKAREKRAKEEQKVVQDQQTAQLDAYSTAKLTKWFDYLVKRIVASVANGEITLDGNGLHATIQWRGRRRSVALNSLRLVLFDIAAMLCAVEGGASSPAFLIHDSPREGDLDPWTYARLFETIFSLGPDEKSAPFQYIVTTTTEPPEGEIRKRVRLELSAESDDTRFLRVDL